MPFKLGLTLGFSLIIAIGAQNIFVIKQGLKREFSYTCATICFLCDAILIGLSVTGTSHLMTQLPILKEILLIGAVAFLTVYGALSIRRGLQIKSEQDFCAALHASSFHSYGKVIAAGLGFSLLNPQALLDTVVLMGGVASHYSHGYQYQFMLGAMLASLLWFYGLTTGARFFAKALQRPRVWQVIELLSGSLMLVIAVKCVLMAINPT